MGRMFEDLKTGLQEANEYLSGKRGGYRTTVPDEIDVKHIRKDLRMTQTKFSDTFGLSLDTVKHWESGRRTPEAAARVLLTVISREPTAVMRALSHDKKTKENKKRLTETIRAKRGSDR